MSEEIEKVELAPLTPKEARFVQEYTTHWNGARAAIDAGYEGRNARNIAGNLRSKINIRAAIDAEMHRLTTENALTKDKLVERLWAIVSADPNELIELRRVNCRHCFGEGGRYQYTDHEMAVRRAKHEKDNRTSLPHDDDGFDLGGGTGFSKTRAPNPDCAECQGVGEELIVPKDTRDLSPSARALFAGVKVTKEGLQVIMHDQLAAADKLGRYLGMFVDRKVLENPDGSAVTMVPIMFNAVAPKSGDDDDEN